MSFIALAAKLTLTGGLLLGTAAPVKVALTAPGHSPRINTHWTYTVHVTNGGKPAAAKITEQIVDPLGTAHPVQFGKNTKNITNWPIDGTFTDFIVWPASSRGIPLTLKIVVQVGAAKKTITYMVTPRA